MQGGVQVALSWSEVQVAAHVGVARRMMALRRGRSEPKGALFDADGIPRDSWGSDIESSAAEYAVARATMQFWSPMIVADLSITPMDVGRDIQVRSTEHENGHLFVFESDNENDAFFLAVGRIPEFRIVGWIRGREAREVGEWKLTPRGSSWAWWVRQDQLHPVHTYIEEGRQWPPS